MPDEQNGSIQSYIRDEIKDRLKREVQKIPVPRLPRLIIRYRTLEPRELIRLGLETQDDDDPVEALISASVDALLAASEGSESDRGEDLGLPLGAALSSFLGLEGAHSDREGLYLIFESEVDIVETANKLSSFNRATNEKVGDDIVKNSQEAVEA